MMKRPAETSPDYAFAAKTLERLSLADAFYSVWSYLTHGDFLGQLFAQHRGRCYHDLLAFDQLVCVLADALTRHHGSGRAAISSALERRALPCCSRAVYGKLSRL